MKAFTIDAENNIAVHASAKAAPKTEGTQLFTSEDALAELAAAWPASRLIDIWNSLAGVTPVKKFKDRPIAVSRIWKAVQTLGDAAPAAVEPESGLSATAAPHAPDAATEAPPAKNDATPVNDAPVAAADEKLLRVLARAFAGLSPEQRDAKWEALKNALATLPPAESHNAAKTGAPRVGSKISQVIALLKRRVA